VDKGRNDIDHRWIIVEERITIPLPQRGRPTARELTPVKTFKIFVEAENLNIVVGIEMLGREEHPPSPD
jgi:hypothetical protein